MIEYTDTDGHCDKCTCGGNVVIRSAYNDGYWRECNTCTDGGNVVIYRSFNSGYRRGCYMIRELTNQQNNETVNPR